MNRKGCEMGPIIFMLYIIPCLCATLVNKNVGMKEFPCGTQMFIIKEINVFKFDVRPSSRCTGSKYIVTLKMSFIAQFPPQLLRLGTSLRTLDLSNNKIKAIPSAIGGFTSLKSLTLASNQLGTVTRIMPLINMLLTKILAKCSVNFSSFCYINHFCP